MDHNSTTPECDREGGHGGMNIVNGTFTLSLENNCPSTGINPSEKIVGIYNLCRQLVSTNTLDVLLHSIVRQAVDILHVRFCRIMTLEPDGNFWCQSTYSTDLVHQIREAGRMALPGAKSLYQHVVLSESPVMIRQGSSLTSEQRLALRMSYQDSLYLIPLRVNQEAVGVLVVGEEYHAMPEVTLKEKMRLAVLIADQAASAIYRAKLSNQLEESQFQTVMTLVKVMESRDPYISGHSQKVTELSVRLARQLNCSPIEVRAIRWAAMLHDIGKVGIRDTVLNKNGSLDTREWDEMRMHPEKGAEIVRMSANMEFVAAIIQAHHEYYDGSGYPHGLKRDMIPFGARILAVADAYSAMRDDRPYRMGATFEEAVNELKRCSGTQFDPMVVEAFLSVLY
jgi:putative nucleotidyltransferase with HDIG domain